MQVVCGYATQTVKSERLTLSFVSWSTATSVAWPLPPRPPRFRDTHSRKFAPKQNRATDSFDYKETTSSKKPTHPIPGAVCLRVELPSAKYVRLTRKEKILSSLARLHNWQKIIPISIYIKTSMFIDSWRTTPTRRKEKCERRTKQSWISRYWSLLKGELWTVQSCIQLTICN